MPSIYWPAWTVKVKLLVLLMTGVALTLPDTCCTVPLIAKLNTHTLGRGCVYSFDVVGSYDRETYRAGGSAASMLQPLLDNQARRCRLLVFHFQGVCIYSVKIENRGELGILHC